ncbi:MAG: DUF3303 family protein [Acidobacteria bacterium]|nr:DUF3303 family protein [Acidobacteriota bacterium]
MLLMIIEKFKNRDAKPVYQRLHERGRMMTEGLIYRDSWIEANFDRCFQLVECDDPAVLQEWIMQWADLVEFEIVPVTPSAVASEIVKKHL